MYPHDELIERIEDMLDVVNDGEVYRLLTDLRRALVTDIGVITDLVQQVDFLQREYESIGPQVYDDA